MGAPQAIQPINGILRISGIGMMLFGIVSSRDERLSLDLNRSVTSNYFIKNKTNISNEEFINLINKCYFPSIEWTVGPKSLPKGELIEIVENKIKEIYKNG